MHICKAIRKRSIPIEPSKCGTVEIGDLVVCFQESEAQAIFDAHVLEIRRTLLEQMMHMGEKKFVKRSDSETSTYLKYDCLSIVCTIGVVQNHAETMQPRVDEGKHYVIPVPPSDMIPNFKGMLKSGIRSDVTFQVGNEFFKAHKSVSWAMLLFLYSDELHEPRELCDLDPHCTSTTIIQHLLVAADRFVLARLKLMCEEKLCSEITTDSVATTLALADHHHCLQLKTDCLNFAAEPENVGKVAKSTQLEKSNP
ncbi:BTB/POZ and MATH domain-containing protein 3-like [Papaver somniferum]|uniref:BTB/POZ and MATH domain-containing protein 3-like n=1 Tax=Papaver somniferum TaxID=3469 RepID=UPI000E6F8B57|nr:BTB/POZ and MATH domain-containing protein 3-like [Papaver somniferum]